MNSFSLYDVMTNASSGKEMEDDDEVILNLRVKREVREQFRIAAKLKGGSMSTLLHQFIVKTIREEKAIDPDAFTKPLKQPKKKVSKLNISSDAESADEMPSMSFEELQAWRAERAKEKEKKKK